MIRRIVRGRYRPRGIDKVFINLCLGLDQLGISYEVNLPFSRLREDDRIAVVGRCRRALEGYDRRNPIVAGPALMTHPSEWPTFCEDYPAVFYLQPSEWCRALFARFFGDRVLAWPVGIDTVSWALIDARDKEFDFLIYDKIMWRRDETVPRLLEPIRSELRRRKLAVTEIRYGQYTEQQYRQALRQSRSMLFLCEHESQGLAYQECLASGVPILAWDQGRWLDPNRFTWGTPDVAATSVPYFDGRCGLRFKDFEDFPGRLEEFLDRRTVFSPRDYILDNLTIEKCSSHFMHILNDAVAATQRRLAQA